MGPRPRDWRERLHSAGGQTTTEWLLIAGILTALCLCLGAIHPVSNKGDSVDFPRGPTGPSSVLSSPRYPQPPVSLVPTAVTVEDFPYLTEEYFVSGTASDTPYTTRILARRPRDAQAFSGILVSEALHAGG
jgi:hypothetical protein